MTAHARQLERELNEAKQHCALALEFLCQAGNGKQYDPSWIRPKLMSAKEIQEACTQAYHYLHKAILREPK